MKIKIASRNSKLALLQVEEVMQHYPELEYEIIEVKSFGDRNKDISLLTNSKADIFTDETDNAVLNGLADIAIHSAKDLPYPLKDGISVVSLLESKDKTDSLVSRGNLKLNNLPKGSRIGTSSQARKKQLLELRPDFEIVSIRGTIEERIAQIQENKIDALIVATCALERLGLEHLIAERLPFETHFLQGNLAVTAKSENYEIAKIFRKTDIQQKYGKIYIAGFGPGNTDLITLKTLKLLQKVDVIVYDDLIDKYFIQNFPAEKIYVGKRSGNHSLIQEKINELLYKLSVSGKNVLRLKGGDPFIFGRGGEEMDYLKSLLIPVEIIPAITSAIGAAAYSEIPLTYREKSSSVSFCSGHSVESFKVPNTETIIVYMGAEHIRETTQKIVSERNNENIPVAFIENATRHNQRVIHTNSTEILNNKISVNSPLIAIFGKTTEKDDKKTWFNSKINILVTGTETEQYEDFGTVFHLPVFRIVPKKNIDFVQFKRYILNNDYIVFTSKFTVRFFFEFLTSNSLDSRILARKNIIAIGEKTNSELKKFGIVADIIPSQESSHGIVEVFKYLNIKNKGVFIPRSNIALNLIPNGLTELGNTVDTMVLYENIQENYSEIPDLSYFDLVVLSSPSCVKNFLQLYKEIPKNMFYLPKGEVTLKELKKNPEIFINIIDYENISSVKKRPGNSR